MKYIVFCLLLILGSCSDINSPDTAEAITQEQPLIIAVASNFYLTLKDLIKEHPDFKEAKLVTGSSGTLYAQAQNGAPFDLFIAADDLYTTKLFESKKSSRPITYAFGKLAIYSSDGEINSIDNTLESAHKIAIANPDIAPYGKAALIVLNQYAISMEDVVFANNVSQAFQFADTGNADLGFVAESLLIHAHQNSVDDKYFNYLLVPASTYPLIRQQLVILSSSRSPNSASQFVDFLLSSNTQDIIERMGYYSADKYSVNENIK